MNKILVYGTGYVGLVTGVCLASLGHQVFCFDINKEKILSLTKGNIPIYENSLEGVVKSAIRKKSITFLYDLDDLNKMGPICDFIDVFIVAVGTPLGKNGAADLSYIWSAVNNTITLAKEGLKKKKTYLLIKSTVPVGTANNIQEKIKQSNLQDKVSVISNPEFLKEGSAVQDFMHPDKIVIGATDEDSQNFAKGLYMPLLKDKQNDIKIINCNNSTAELIKYGINSYLSMRLSFINQLSNLCEKTNTDIVKLLEGMGSDGRIGSLYLSAGPGYGGSCFPKDTRELIFTSRYYGTPMTLLQLAVNFNEDRKSFLVHRITEGVKNYMNTCHIKKERVNILILGLAFKGETDDIRESVSIDIIENLVKHYCKNISLFLYDSKATNNFIDYFNQFKTYF